MTGKCTRKCLWSDNEKYVLDGTVLCVGCGRSMKEGVDCPYGIGEGNGLGRFVMPPFVKDYPYFEQYEDECFGLATQVIKMVLKKSPDVGLAEFVARMNDTDYANYTETMKDVLFTFIEHAKIYMMCIIKEKMEANNA